LLVAEEIRDPRGSRYVLIDKTITMGSVDAVSQDWSPGLQLPRAVIRNLEHPLGTQYAEPCIKRRTLIATALEALRP
jgi:hypothetical protein